VEINGAWGTVRENIKMFVKGSEGYYKSKKHKPCVNKVCSKLLFKGKKLNCIGYMIQVKQMGII
jgi:hypothetical protein